MPWRGGFENTCIDYSYLVAAGWIYRTTGQSQTGQGVCLGIAPNADSWLPYRVQHMRSSTKVFTDNADHQAKDRPLTFCKRL
jgi:hypothetical protein